jgi:hypothetical protein
MCEKLDEKDKQTNILEREERKMTFGFPYSTLFGRSKLYSAHMQCEMLVDRDKPTIYGKVRKEEETNIWVSIFDSLW